MSGILSVLLANAASTGVPGPETVTGLYIWLKSDTGVYQGAGITPVASDGDPVGRWADQSGNARHFNEATNKPSWRTSQVNGYAAIQFDGSTTLLTGPDASALTAGEIFIVFKQDVDPPTGSSHGFWCFGSHVSGEHVPFTDGKIYDGFGSTVRKDTNVDPTPSMASWGLYNVVSASGEWTNFLNGTQLFTTGTNTVGFNSSILLGLKTSYYKGMFAEVIMYNGKLSAGNKTIVKNYIAARYGLTIS